MQILFAKDNRAPGSSPLLPASSQQTIAQATRSSYSTSLLPSTALPQWGGVPRPLTAPKSIWSGS